MTEYRLGEMFSGPGGIALGAKQASKHHLAGDGDRSSIRHQWAVDYDCDTTATYSRNITGEISSSSVHTADVRDFDIRDAGGFNAFAFGFPCNDFSLVGERKGLDGEFGPLFSYGIHAIALNSPDWFLAENVSGLRRANEGRALGRILSALRDPGAEALQDAVFGKRYRGELERVDAGLEYEIVAHLYRFEEYRVPQRRHRVLIVGVRKDLAEQLPRPFMVPRPPTRHRGMQQTASEALEMIPIPDNAPNHQLTRHPQHVVDRLAAIPPGGNAFNTEFKNDSLRLNVRGATLSNIYRRLHPDEPAYTVTGSGGGGTHMYHWRENRALTNRERARLQTFPDDFEFIGGRQSVRKQVGMAVPPDGVEPVFRAILNTMDGIPYETDPNGPNIDAEQLICAYRGRLGDDALLDAMPIEQDANVITPAIG